MKPTDLSLRVYELFSILIPGLLFVVVLAYSSHVITVPDHDVDLAAGFVAYSGGEKWFLVVMLGFVSGHLIEGLGSLLDTLEWKLFLRVTTIFDGWMGSDPSDRSSWTLVRWVRWICTRLRPYLPFPVLNEFGPLRAAATEILRARLKTDLPQEATSRRWGAAYLYLHAPDNVKTHLSYLDAHRRSVRNIAVLTLLTVSCTVLRHQMAHAGYFLAIAPWVLLVFTWYRHQQMQWRYTQTIFEYLVIDCGAPGCSATAAAFGVR